MTTKIEELPGSQGKTKLPVAAWWVLASVAITNIGNGMHTLTVAKLLYDQTGSAFAFGGVIVVESIVNLLLQLLAGPYVDRTNPKTTSAWSELIRGIFIVFVSFMLASPSMFWWITASVIVINIAKPFYRSAIFALAPAIVPAEQLTRYNVLFNSLFQVGQLLGVGLAGIIIQNFGATVAFGVDGLTYLLSGACILLASVPIIEIKAGGGQNAVKNFLDDWKEIGVLFRSNVAFLWHVILSSGDYLAISLVNLSIVPIATQWFGGNAYWMSAFDGSFALGFMLAAGVTTFATKKWGAQMTAVLGLAGQAICFALMSVLQLPYLVAGLMVGIGLSNAISIAIFASTLQQRSQGPIKGRISSIRNLFMALVIAIVVPIVAYIQSISLAQGLLASAVICAVFSATTFILGRRRVYGSALLGEEATV